MNVVQSQNWERYVKFPAIVYAYLVCLFTEEGVNL